MKWWEKGRGKRDEGEETMREKLLEHNIDEARIH